MKNLIYKILLFFGYLFHRNSKSKVLFYHDVSTRFTKQGTSKELMKAHFDEIRKQGFDIVAEINHPQKQVQICFDDGWEGLYENKDFFIKEGVRPTTFIIISRIGNEGYMTLEQIRELDKLDFRFGCHTWSHKYLTSFDDEGLKHELIDSKAELEKLLGHTCSSICFPMGVFSDKVFNVCKEAGYHEIYASIREGYKKNEKTGLIYRTLIQTASNWELKMILKGFSPILQKRDIKREYKK